MNGPYISSKYAPLHLILIQNSVTVGKNTLAGAISNLVSRKSTSNTASNLGCSSFPNPLAKMSLHWIGEEKSSEDNLFESLTTLVLGKCFE